ncbi:MAG: methionyl-tRNA formyltransferase, partial [Oscillospiraceae bacterium]
IITVAPVDIGINETSKELFEKVSKLGAQTLCDTIEDIKCGKAQRIAQDASKATFAPMLNKEIANIDFNMSYIKLHNLIRGLNPWPIARFIYDNKQIKILKTRCTDESADKCGTVISINPLTIACKDGAVILDEVIPQGSKLMSGAQWAAGKRLAVGQIL